MTKVIDAASPKLHEILTDVEFERLGGGTLRTKKCPPNIRGDDLTQK